MKKAIFKSLSVAALCLGAVFAQAQTSLNTLAGIKLGQAMPQEGQGVKGVSCEPSGRLSLVRSPEQFCFFEFNAAHHFEGKLLTRKGGIFTNQGQVVAVTVSIPVPPEEQERLSGWLTRVAQRNGMALIEGDGYSFLYDAHAVNNASTVGERALSPAIFAIGNSDTNELQLYLTSFEIAVALSEVNKAQPDAQSE